MSYKLLTSMSVIAIGCFTAGVNVGVYLETPHVSLQQEAREEVLNEILRQDLVTRSVSLEWEVRELAKLLELGKEIEKGNIHKAAEELEAHYLFEIYKLLPKVEDAVSKAPAGLDLRFVEEQVSEAKALMIKHGAYN